MANTQDGALHDCDRQLNALRQQFNDFMSTTAHELRNPVQTVLGLTDLMDADELPERYGVAVMRMRQDAVHLAQVVDDLYYRAELASGSLRTRCQPFNLEPLLVEVAQTIEHLYPGRLSLEYGELPLVVADAGYVRKILMNLLLNSMRGAKDDATSLIRLVAAVAHARQQVDLRVQDVAAVIPVEYREAVFEPMAELPPEVGQPRFGLGLGLYAGRAIARQMGGDLWLTWADSGSAGNVFALCLRCGQVA